MNNIILLKDEIEFDKRLGIHTSEIEEWDGQVLDYHRSEPTPYRGLYLLVDTYQPPENPFLIDVGSALGRINFFFYHYFHVPGIGLEVDPLRCKRAGENLVQYAKNRGIEMADVEITFLQQRAEEYEPPEHANIFYFFHPFSDWIFRRTLEKIITSIDRAERTVDLILYYPSFQYFQAIESSGYFEQIQFVDCTWSLDDREGFWIYRHQ